MLQLQRLLQQSKANRPIPDPHIQGGREEVWIVFTKAPEVGFRGAREEKTMTTTPLLF
jgi:hypothetical protein